MTSRDFAYWLQGFFEVADPKEINSEQIKMIKNHLNMVFVHEIDPSMGDEEHQKILNKVHNSDKIVEEKVVEEKVVVKHQLHTPDKMIRC